MGSLQAPQLSGIENTTIFQHIILYVINDNIVIYVITGPEPLAPLVAEEKVVFGLNAKAMSQLTLAKIRKVYSRADNKSIAKQV